MSNSSSASATRTKMSPLNFIYRLPQRRAGLWFSVARRFRVQIGTYRRPDPCPVLFWSRPKIKPCFVTQSDTINRCILACKWHLSIRFVWSNRIYTYVVTSGVHCTSHPCYSSVCTMFRDFSVEKCVWVIHRGYGLDKLILNQNLNLTCYSGVLLPHISWQICVLNFWTFALTNLFLLPSVIYISRCLSVRTGARRQLFCCRNLKVTIWSILQATELLPVTLRCTFSDCLCALETKQLLPTCRKVHEHCSLRHTAMSVVEKRRNINAEDHLCINFF
jgi:hypothetical protein